MKLTTAGRTLIMSGGVLVVIGLLVGYPELVALGAAGLTWILAALAVVVARPALRAERAVPRARVTEGTPMRCIVRATNAGWVASPEVGLLEEVAGRPFRLRLPPLPPGRSESFEYELPMPRRGVYRFVPLSIERADPARLAVRRVSLGPEITVYVHPSFHDLPLFGAGDLAGSDGRASRPTGGGVAFFGLREYIPGDDLRLIHWPTSARLGSLAVRQLSVPDAPGYQVVLDTARSLYPDDSFEDAVRIAASLAVAVMRLGAQLHLRTTGGTALVNTLATPNASSGPALDFLAAVGLTDRYVVAPAVVDRDLLGSVLVTGEVGGSALESLVAPLNVAGPVSVVQICSAIPRRFSICGAQVLSVRNSSEFAVQYRGLE
ncbi:DUF58 domain-containing protein [Dactylosporangium sp. CA-092794]|uniref:DUF58 domain-containing protein n=1 Tax=Dactylosporangium sp. CA-092794 TaxID=3239929 RepID=UPI003D9316D1